MGCIYFVGFLPSIKDEQVLPRALSFIAVNNRSAVEGCESVLTYISGCRERIRPRKLNFQHQVCDPVLPPRRRPHRDAELAPRAEVPALCSVPAAAGAREAVTAAFAGLCQGTLYSWKGFSVSVCRRCFDSD